MVKDVEFVSDKHLFKLAKLMREKGLKCQVVTDEKESSQKAAVIANETGKILLV